MSTEEQRIKQRQSTDYHPFNALEVTGFPVVLWSNIPISKTKQHTIIIQDITKGKQSKYCRNPEKYIVYECQLVTALKNDYYEFRPGSFIELHIAFKSFKIAIDGYPKKTWGQLNTKSTTKYPVKITIKRTGKQKIVIDNMEVLEANKKQNIDFTTELN